MPSCEEVKEGRVSYALPLTSPSTMQAPGFNLSRSLPCTSINLHHRGSIMVHRYVGFMMDIIALAKLALPSQPFAAESWEFKVPYGLGGQLSHSSLTISGLHDGPSPRH